MNGELEKRSPFWIGLSVGQRDRPLKAVVSKPEISITVGLLQKYCSSGLIPGEYDSVGGGRLDVCVKLNSTGASADREAGTPAQRSRLVKYGTKWRFTLLSSLIQCIFGCPFLTRPSRTKGSLSFNASGLFSNTPSPCVAGHSPPRHHWSSYMSVVPVCLLQS